MSFAIYFLFTYFVIFRCDSGKVEVQIHVQHSYIFLMPLFIILFISSAIFFKSINIQFHLQFKKFKLLKKCLNLYFIQESTTSSLLHTRWVRTWALHFHKIMSYCKMYLLLCSAYYVRHYSKCSINITNLIFKQDYKGSAIPTVHVDSQNCCQS